jgi:hypothetical protein
MGGLIGYEVVASLVAATLEETAGTEPWRCILMDEDAIN